MKASINTTYGSPEVLHIMDVEKPTLKNNEILIKVHATTVNRTDCGFRKPEAPFIIRPIHGLINPKRRILGSELSGVVEAIGKDVTSFKIGDKVFGLSTFLFGAHAEYICMDENRSIVHMPLNISYEEAAAVCDGAFLALANIKKIDFSTKPKILVNGASGSIGTACVQLAHYYGAEVTAVCGTKNIELLKTLGATSVIDYTKEDFTKCVDTYDVILDMVGKSSFFKCLPILTPQGIYISSELGYMAQNIFLALFTPFFKGKKVLFPLPKDTKEDMVLLRELIEKGNYKAVIDRVYPLERIVEATKYVETGEKTGNVVISIVS